MEEDLWFVRKGWGKKKRRQTWPLENARRKSMNHRPRIYFRWDENPTQPWTTLKASKNSFRIPGGTHVETSPAGSLIPPRRLSRFHSKIIVVYLCPPTTLISTFDIFTFPLAFSWKLKIQLTALRYSLRAVSTNAI